MTSMSLPMMFFLQTARGLTPTEAALLLIPMAVLSGALAPAAGKLLDRVDRASSSSRVCSASPVR